MAFHNRHGSSFVPRRSEQGGDGAAKPTITFLPRDRPRPRTSASLRIPQEMLKAWVDVLAPRADLRGAPAVAKEMEALLGKAGADGHVVIGRHQLFTWAETLQGVARRAPLGSPVQGIVDEIRAVLAGKDPAAASGGVAPPRFAPSPPASSPASTYAFTPPPPAPAYAAPAAAPVTYVRGAAPASTSTGSAGIRLVGETDVAGVVAGLLWEAKHELLVVSPWTLGLETLVEDLVRTPQSVAIRIVSRRADREDEAYHRALRDLQRRGAELVMSPFLHTRMVVADGEALLLGAAGVGKPGFNVAREAAILTSEPKAVADARAHFARIMEEARRGPPR